MYFIDGEQQLDCEQLVSKYSSVLNARAVHFHKTHNYIWPIYVIVL